MLRMVERERERERQTDRQTNREREREHMLFCFMSVLRNALAGVYSSDGGLFQECFNADLLTLNIKL